MILDPARRPAWSWCLVAVLSVVLAAALRTWLWGVSGTPVPFITFYPAVILAALYGGLTAGLLATALSALVVLYGWMAAGGSSYLRDPATCLGLGVFITCCVAVSLIARATERCHARAVEAEARVRLAMDSSRVEEELRIYRLLAEHSRDIILYMRRDNGNILEANAAAEKAYGYTRGELQTLSIHHLRSAATHELTDEQLAQADAEGILFETVHRRKDGSTFPVEVSSQGATINGPRTLISVIRDITERKRSEEVLREGEARYRRLVDLMPEALLVVQEERIVYCNRAAARLYGAEQAPERLLGVSLLDRVHPTDRSTVQQRLRSAAGGARLAVRETRHLRLDGSVLAVETTAGAIEWNGQPAVLIFIADITDRKRADARLRDAQKLESLGVLAGGVAHDFNNLLVGVIGNASLARDLLPAGHPAAGLLQEVLRAGEKATHLTRQMLAYSGKGKFVVEPLNLSALLPEMSELVRPSISSKIDLDLELQPDLPSIEADRGQIQQVFLNLVLNAAEAIGDGEGLITIRTCVQEVDEQYQRLYPVTATLEPGKHVCLEVHDTGCGMDETIQAKIFDPFFSTKFVGRGLGLAAVSGIVRGHKGAITVRSAPRQGSCFTILFPAVRIAHEPPPPAVNAATPGTRTVLVVDDEPAVRVMAQRALEFLGYTVLLADSGMAAIDVFRTHPGEIALAILDLSMPHGNGQEVLPAIRKIRPEVKVVISSGYSEASSMPLFKGQRVAGFIQKPYTVTELAEKLKACLG